MTAGLRRLLPALLLLIPLAAARADEPVPDAAALYQKMRAASGQIPPVLRQSIVTESSDGSNVTRLRFQRGSDYRDVFDDGPFHTERGSVKGELWHENENGQVVIEQPGPGEAVREPTTTTTVSRVHAPVEAYVIATLTARGGGTKEYIDPATWHVVRREAIGANGTILTVYDDFHEDHGRSFAHHWRVDNAVTRTTSNSRVTLYEPDGVRESDVTIPVPRRALVEFPAGTRSLELPTRFAPFGHIYVRVMAGDRGLDFILDTGSYGITMDEQIAKELGITPYGEHSTVTAARHTIARAVVPELRVGDLRMRNVMVHLEPQGWQEQAGVKTVGLLGFDFLAELGVTIDYEHKRVTAVRGEEYRPPPDPRTTPLDVRLGTGQPLATVSVNGASGDRFILDTGGVGTFLIHDYFARRHPEAIRDEGAGARSRPLRFSGIGGAFDVRAYQIKSLKLANIDFSEFIGYRVTSSGSYAGPTDGVIAPDFLRLFTLGLDYGNARIYLTPNADGRRAMGIK
jgi:predicted aspartyl protease